MKTFIATSLIASIATLGVARAEESPAALPIEQTAPEQTTAQTEPVLEQNISEQVSALPLEEEQAEQPQSTLPQTDEKPYAHVGKASNDAVAAARSKQWQNILIAAGAVAIAVTALILVHNNAGH